MSNLKKWIKGKEGRAKEVAGRIVTHVNEFCNLMFESGHRFVFAPPENLQVKVTASDIQLAQNRLKVVRTLDAKECVVFLEQTGEGDDFKLNTMGFYDPDYDVPEAEKQEDFMGDMEPNRFIQFSISNLVDRAALSGADDFEAGRFIEFKNTEGSRWFRADILNWNRRILSLDGTETSSYLLNTFMDGGKAELLAFLNGFRTVALHEAQRPSARHSRTAVSYRFGNAPSTIKGQLETQGIAESKVTAGKTFRLCAGDYVRSARPNLDSMSYFSSLNITADSGILFKPTYTGNGSRPVLLNLPLDTPFSIGATDSFRVNSISLTPRGDVYYSSRDPRLHQMSTNIPLRHARLFLEMQPRDSLIPVKATLQPRGQFEVLLGFWKRT